VWVVGGGWWVVGGGWWLVGFGRGGGWLGWLVAGGWSGWWLVWLVAGGWWLVAGGLYGWWLVAGGVWYCFGNVPFAPDFGGPQNETELFALYLRLRDMRKSIVSGAWSVPLSSALHA